ncbi:MAG: universal stress protein [Psychroflexus sp.]|nr:universal stress protein [Psychroflexus sp.]MDN6311150.1 universal stress protein [Psychroflexus sp.]
MQKILVPTDFSEQSQNALKVSAQIARKYNSEIHLLHLLDLPLDLIDPINEGVGGDLPESLFFMKLAHKKFTETFEKFQKELDGLVVHETVEFNQAFEGIMEITDKHDCDLIVMGSNSVSGLQEVFIGSNTEKVVRNSNVPVLVIKGDTPIFSTEEMVFASSLKDTQNKTFQETVRLAKLLDARLTLIYINTPHSFKTNQFIEDRLKEFTKGIDTDAFNFEIYSDKSIEKGVRNFANKVNADLIGIGTHGRKGIAHFFNGSHSESLVNHAKRPVITFKI